MLKGNQEFVLVDDQKLVFENALALAKESSPKKKGVMIVEGGPGTGKSVVAINLLAALTRLRKLARYVSKNAAPRTVYESKLTGKMRKTEISNLFSGSGVFTEGKPSEFDVLIVDEAHRLNEKSGLYQNLGDNQIKELISAASCSIFFIDENQRVTLKDIGRKSEIEKWALNLGASVSHAKLESQFRCSGSDGYLAWLDGVLGVHPTANESFDRGSFDFQVVDSPNALREMIRAANKENNRARMVAGYCWNWVSKKRPQEYDIVMPGYDFQARWNLSSDGSLWIVAPESVEEIGCIHTSQGLEVDYIGVIVGPDFIVRSGKVVTVPEGRARTDKSLSGYKKRRKAGDEQVAGEADEVIRNTYRTLMTRGMKGCFIYSTDADTANYFRSRLRGPSTEPSVAPLVKEAGVRIDSRPAGEILPFRRVQRKEAKPYVDSVPVIDLKIAAGKFSEVQFQETDIESANHDDWAVLPDFYRPRKGLFVAQVVGESMNRQIPNGAWCLFQSRPGGTRNGSVVVAQHRDIHDPDTGGSYTVKVYRSEKAKSDSSRNVLVRLRPDSTVPGFQELVFKSGAASKVEILAVLLKVL